MRASENQQTASLRRAHSEGSQLSSRLGEQNDGQEELDRLPARAQSISTLIAQSKLTSERPATLLKTAGAIQKGSAKFDCLILLPSVTDSSRAHERSSGSLSASTFNLLDEDVLFAGRERGSRTSIENVKSREDLIMSDHGGFVSPSKPQQQSSLKVSIGEPKQIDKRVLKKRRAEKDKTQKESTNPKVVMQLDSPGAIKLKHKHVPSGGGGQETANWPVWNTVRSSRTRLNESTSELEEFEAGEQSAVDDASWQFISMLSFRHGQRDDSKYRQLSAGESSASEPDIDAAVGANVDSSRDPSALRLPARNQVQPVFRGEPSQPVINTNLYSTDVNAHSPSSQRAAEENWAKWDCVAEKQSDAVIEPKAEADDRLVPQQATGNEKQKPDASSRPLLFDQDDSDASNDVEADADLAADCMDVLPLDEADCAADFLLYDHAKNGVTEEDAISCAKQNFYAALSGTLDANANSNAENVQKQVLYGLDPRDTSDDDQQRVAAVAVAVAIPPPPPPPRRTVPTSSTAATTNAIITATTANTATTSSSSTTTVPQPTDSRSSAGRSTPNDAVGLALLPPPPTVPRRSNTSTKPKSAISTKRQHWLARFDDEEETGAGAGAGSGSLSHSVSNSATVSTSTSVRTRVSVPSMSVSLHSAQQSSIIVNSTVRFAVQRVNASSEANEDEEDDSATCSDEQTRIMTSSSTRRRSFVNANSIGNGGATASVDGTGSLGRAAKKQRQKRVSGGSSSSSRPESQLGQLVAETLPTDTVLQPMAVSSGHSQLKRPDAATEASTAFANLSFVDCTSDYDARSPRAAVDADSRVSNSQKTVFDGAATRSSSAGDLHFTLVSCNVQKLGDANANRSSAVAAATARPGAGAGTKEVTPTSRNNEKEVMVSNSRRTLLASFLRKPHVSNDSSSSGSTGAIAKDDTPDSPTPTAAAFHHHRFPSASPSCSSLDSDKIHMQPENAKSSSQQQSGGLLASLSAFTLPRSLRRGAAKKSAAQPSAVTSDVCG